MNSILNILNYQLIWLLCVLAGNQGATLALPLLTLHLYCSRTRKAEVWLMAGLVGCGALLDGSLQSLGLITFYGTGWPVPWWLLLIWAALAILPLHSLRWLGGQHLLNIFFGGLTGPLAYWAGARLEAAALTPPIWQPLLALTICWAIIWPLCMQLAGQLAEKTAAAQLDSISRNN